MHIFEPINLAPQPFIQSIMDSTPWPDCVKTATPEQVREILFALGWPTDIIPNMLLCSMPPGWASKIHLDEKHGHDYLSVINVPVRGTPELEWYEPKDPSAPITMYSPIGRDIAQLALEDARMIATTKGCGLAYLGNSSQWHRVVNAGPDWASVFSIRYIPESYSNITQDYSRLPWVARLRNK